MSPADSRSTAQEQPPKRPPPVAEPARGNAKSSPEEVAGAQLAIELGVVSENLNIIGGQAFRYANPDSGQLVIDIAALVSAMLNLRTPGSAWTATEWLRHWAHEHKLDFMIRAEPSYADQQIVLSASLRVTVLPRAIALRDKTMGSMPEPVGLRHMLFALAEQNATQWPPLENGGRVTPERLNSLRNLIVEQIARSPLSGEDMAAWRAQLGDSPPNSVAPPSEATPLLSDNPADADSLGRQPLADALAARLVRLQAGEAASSDPRAVMVHLQGAWGSGKSSMVRFLGAELAKQDPPWMLVEFNAWRNARVNPPWWNMLTECKRSVAARLPWWRRLLLDIRWAWVSPSVDNVLIVLGALLTLALLIVFGAQALSTVETLKTIGGGVAAVLLALGTVRSVMLGGKRTADSFDALRTDSFQPFIALFKMLVKSAPAPMLIVLDDIDRCDAETVTDLLEGIQTLYRGEPVVFLAVADRHWITTSFAERFKLFESAGDKARPLGDLFLDKMFQLTVPLPALPDKAKRAYLGALLGGEAAPAAPPAFLPETAVSHEAIQAAIAAADDAAQPALRAQAVARLSTPTADKVIEHRLLRWAELVEANPRGMKRLVNAIGMAQARSFLEARDVPFDTIVLWTILELRWPRTAEAIASNPALIDQKDSGPDPMRAAWADPLFRRMASKLDAAQVRAMLGIETG